LCAEGGAEEFGGSRCADTPEPDYAIARGPPPQAYFCGPSAR
jgi:hypothetical protein